MDDERLDLRNLPAPPALRKDQYPRRLSQTLLAHVDNCPRAGYFYLKYSGGAATKEMDRGTAVHLFAERMMLDLIREGEKSLVAMVEPGDEPGRAEDPEEAGRQVASLTEAMVEEIRGEHPELVMPAAEWDRVRQMAYHCALGNDVDPDHVAGIERKFVLDLPRSGWQVSGKIDLLSLPEPGHAVVTDYKSSKHVPTEAEFEETFQTKLYACLVMFGVPVEKMPDGSERRLEPIGEHLGWVQGRQVYPFPRLRQDGAMQRREKVWTRTDLHDFMVDVEAKAEAVTRGLTENEWAARYGSHCSMCPSKPECPLPPHLRRWHGSIETREQAEEALEWSEVMGAAVRATKAEVRSFAKTLPSGSVRAGKDVYYELEVSNGRAVRKKGQSTDWDGLMAAITDALENGREFDIEEWVRPTSTTNFKKKKLSSEMQAAFDAVPAQSADEKWGEDAPW